MSKPAVFIAVVVLLALAPSAWIRLKRSLCALAVLLLAAGGCQACGLFGAVLITEVAAGGAKSHACGVERQDVKSLTDPAAGVVDTNPTHITVAVLGASKLHAMVRGNEPRDTE